MADVVNAETKVTATGTATAAVEGKKSKKISAISGAKKPKSKPTHPPTAFMVNSAIRDLKERSGSSLPAIKKYLAANYKVDAEKLAPFIKKYLKNSVASGKLIQTKGKGASGSFKLPPGSAKKTEKGESGNVVKKKKPATKKLKEKVVKDKSEKKKSEKKKSEKKKSAASAAKSVKKAGSPKAKAAKPKKEKPKKEKTAKAAPKTPKTPKPKKLAAPKKTVTKKIVKK